MSNRHFLTVRATAPWLSALAAILLVVGAGWLITSRPAPPPAVERSPSGSGPRQYAEALQRLGRAVDGAAEVERAKPDEWTADERLANALMARGRLSGSFADYGTAQAALDRAFADAPAGAGPHPTQMALDFAMHRLDRSAAMADAIDRYVVPDRALRSEAALTRGDIAFYRGDYAKALALYQSAGTDADDPGLLLRTAALYGWTGKPDKALALIDRCEREARLPNALFLANLALRRGTIELQRGRWDEASRHFDRAARLFPGWWLADAHRAQMLAFNGKTILATNAFLKVARISGSPEAMDAVASLYRSGGDRERATFWADQARMIWNERLRVFPQASYGHAVEHILAFGDPATALTLARLDYANRPYGMTATALAWALIANNDAKGALAAIEPVLRSQWVWAESHLVAAQAHLLLGQIEEAEAERQTALAINPRAADRSATLAWFGH